MRSPGGSSEIKGFKSHELWNFGTELPWHFNPRNFVVLFWVISLVNLRFVWPHLPFNLLLGHLIRTTHEVGGIGVLGFKQKGLNSQIYGLQDILKSPAIQYLEVLGLRFLKNPGILVRPGLKKRGKRTLQCFLLSDLITFVIYCVKLFHLLHFVKNS